MAAHNPVFPGDRFGLLVVKEEAPRKYGRSKFWRCVCDCGGTTVVCQAHLRSGYQRSCGCQKRKHQESCEVLGDGTTRPATPEYRAWLGMKARCYDPDCKGYKNWGGRGIRVCDKWLNNFHAFLKDVGRRPGPEYSLNRKENDGNYESGNVEWATQKEQMHNIRTNVNLTYNGKTQCMAVWAEELGVDRGTLWQRLNKGWSVEKTLTTPFRVTSRSRKVA